MPFLLAEILNFQCALHLKDVGSLSQEVKEVLKNICYQYSQSITIELNKRSPFEDDIEYE